MYVNIFPHRCPEGTCLRVHLIPTDDERTGLTYRGRIRAKITCGPYTDIPVAEMASAEGYTFPPLSTLAEIIALHNDLRSVLRELADEANICARKINEQIMGRRKEVHDA